MVEKGRLSTLHYRGSSAAHSRSQEDDSSMGSDYAGSERHSRLSNRSWGRPKQPATTRLTQTQEARDTLSMHPLSRSWTPMVKRSREAKTGECSGTHTHGGGVRRRRRIPID